MTINYSGTFLTSHRGYPGDELVGALVEQLADYRVTFGPTASGRLEVAITYPADTLQQAIHTGLGVVGTVLAGTDVEVVGATVLSVAELEERHGLEAMPDLLSVTETAELLGVSPQAVRQQLDGGRLGGIKVGATWVVPRVVAESRAAKVATRGGPA